MRTQATALDLEITLEQAVIGAKDYTDKRVKMNLFRLIGWQAYQSWFQFNNFVFLGMKDKEPQFNVSNGFALKTIQERYLNQITQAFNQKEQEAYYD